MKNIPIILLALAFIVIVWQRVDRIQQHDIAKSYKDSTAYWKGRYDSVGKAKYWDIIWTKALSEGRTVFIPSDSTELPYIMLKSDSCEIYRHCYDSIYHVQGFTGSFDAPDYSTIPQHTKINWWNRSSLDSTPLFHPVRHSRHRKDYDRYINDSEIQKLPAPLYYDTSAPKYYGSMNTLRFRDIDNSMIMYINESWRDSIKAGSYYVIDKNGSVCAKAVSDSSGLIIYDSDATINSLWRGVKYWMKDMRQKQSKY